MYKIIASDQKEYGPVSADDIRQWIAEGRANGQTPVQQVGDTDWRPLSFFPEFAAALGASPLGAPLPFSTAAGPAPALTPEEIIARDYDLDLAGCFTRSWELVKGNFLPVVGISFLVTIVLSAVNQGIGLIYRVPMQSMIENHEITPLGIGLILFGILLGMPIQSVILGGLYNFYLKMIRKEDTSVSDAFAGFTSSFGQLALGGFVVGVLTLVGIALCIVPGLFLSVAWIFSIPLIIDKKMGFWQAMELSRKVVTRHWFMVFVLLIMIGLVSACGIIACCIGIFVTAPIAWVAMMYAYEDLFNRRILKRSTAVNCAIVNQLATPGLGSLMARRYVAGTIQLLLALAGFGLVIGGFIQMLVKSYRLASDLPPEPDRFPGLGKIGWLIFFAAWLLSWPTTISVLREARKNPPPRPIPPKI